MHTPRHSRQALVSSRKTMARAVSAAVVAGSLSAPAWSQELEEVVVTATKRTESVQDVPLAITALSGDFMRQVNLNDVKDLVTFTPGVAGNSQDSFIDAISVRGVRTQDFGIGLDPSSAFFKNDLYEGRNGSAITSLYDLNRAEILRGPQGFLFGRNSIGGAFSVHTERAAIGSTDGYVDVDIGENERFVAEAANNIPINDNLAMRLAGYYSTEDGFQDNDFPGSDDLIEHDKWALRWSTTFENEKFGVYTMVEYEDREQSGSVYRAVTEGEVWETLTTALGPIPMPADDEDISVDRAGGDNDDGEILTLGVRVDYDMEFATLTSNTGYKDHDYFYNEDYDGTPRNLETYRQDQSGDYFQQELRLTSNSEGALSWYAGVSYYKENIEADYRFAGEEDIFCQYYGYYYTGMTFTGCVDYYAYNGSVFTPSANGLLEETGNIEGEYEGWGAYVNLAYEINENWIVEAGVRYTDDEKEFTVNIPEPVSELGSFWAWGFNTDGDISDTQSWDEVTPRAIVKWLPTEDAMVFASYTAGYKSGGFGTFTLNPDAAGEMGLTQADGFLPDPVDPEEADSYEIGYKDTWWDGKANVDLTVFYYEYTDLQITVGTDSGATEIENVGEVEAWGTEASITTMIGEYLTAYATVGYLDSEATELQNVCDLEDPLGCEDSPLWWNPDWSGALVLTANYPIDGGAITGSLETYFESSRGRGWEDLDELEIDSYTEVALRVGYQSDDNWFVEAYVENLTDEFTWDGVNHLGGKEPDAFFGPRRGRFFGMRAGLSWD